MAPFEKKTKLSAREVRVAELYCFGWSAKEIGTDLDIPGESVKTYLKSIRVFWTGGMSMSRRDFYQRAIEEGIIS